MDGNQTLIDEIEQFCRGAGIAESTFGRQVVNDGKFVGRLRSGCGVTTTTVTRVRRYMSARSPAAKPAAASMRAASPAEPVKSEAANETAPIDGDKRHAFRFYDNRQKYLMFVNTCSEKRVVAERVGMELAHVHPRPPALRVFDAGMGDGTVLARVMRQMHRRFSTLPFYIVGKEISLEDVRLSLEKMPDRFNEHPATVLVITNLYYTESPWLTPRSMQAAATLNWLEVPLAGDSAHDFDEQITNLQPTLSEGWQVRPSPKTGNPLYVRPSMLVLYREDHKFLLDSIIPRPGQARADYDLVIASQPYRARMPVEFKAQKVIAPLAKGLCAGRADASPIQSAKSDRTSGKGPGAGRADARYSLPWPRSRARYHSQDLARRGPFQDQSSRITQGPETGDRPHSPRPRELDLHFNTYSDKRAIFRYDMHTLPTELDGGGIGTSTLLAAWNAATYVAQIEDERLEDVIHDGSYLDATREVLTERGGLWFYDESFVVSRRRG